MIGRLRGVLVLKQPPQLMVEVNGVGYELEAPLSTFYELPQTGDEVILHTHLHVREDAHVLFAFASPDERALFRSLIRVSGVGAKMALAILSGMSAEAFHRCVMDNDITTLTRLPGIGRKTAERLIIEMRDKVTEQIQGQVAPGGGSVAPLSGPADPAGDAVAALVSLGYKPQEASRLVSKVEKECDSSEEMIRRALKATLKN
ncbi:Holliday junction branch migration protein RuvA [Ectothiorhodospira variabilis]|uniref:Holliday junction branch migration protein RuvA n=1 Tax=Ectothiorhodospira variabilis TaxID=505694 RepID=UPI001EFA6FDD|nr:Holliday junction branch migration protein RuvA [Ectothiorhodospira variabilis]MCG5493342.1 Holliday junction branch migration protein RuvA [Ectothiorhodospira variabilis]MCG5502671.1 Holliday junction branch migration protein RuvA [Ectothiorhodospira variabilis]MCG5505563.1 Holliday junction branch migration protein RuvA [Ectothiorhodospira variabilis]